MRASELVHRLAFLGHHQGDLDVVVHVVSEGQTFPLVTLVETEEFGDDGRRYLVLTTEPLEV